MAGFALRVDLRSSSVLEACFHWFSIDTFVDEVKTSGVIVSFTPIGDRQCAGRTLSNRPRGRFGWTTHTYFQKTQPGSCTHTPLNQ
jgi:hypothetical protein